MRAATVHGPDARPFNIVVQTESGLGSARRVFVN